MILAPLQYHSFQEQGSASRGIQSGNLPPTVCMRRAGMAVPVPISKHWKASENSTITSGYTYRCFPSGLGSSLPRYADWRCVNPRRARAAHQLPRATGSMECYPGILPEKIEHHCVAIYIYMVVQYQCGSLHQPYGWNEVTDS